MTDDRPGILARVPADSYSPPRSVLARQEGAVISAELVLDFGRRGWAFLIGTGAVRFVETSGSPALRGKPLRNRIPRALLHVAIGSCAAVALVMAMSLPAAADGPFADFSGSWSGSGTLRPENGAAERIRCNANYRQRGSSQREIDLQLRGASDSYNFDLSGQFSADGQNQVSGRWSERTRNVGGTAVGNANGDRVQLHVEAPGFSAEVIMVTRSRRQSVTIDSHGGGQVVKASISLNRS